MKRPYPEVLSNLSLKSSTSKELLESTLAILQDKSRWTKGAPARDINGHPAPASAYTACSFCLLGALHVAARLSGDQIHIIDRALETLDRVLIITQGKKYGYLSIFNDSPETQHQDVISLIEAAIAITPSYY